MFEHIIAILEALHRNVASVFVSELHELGFILKEYLQMLFYFYNFYVFLESKIACFDKMPFLMQYFHHSEEILNEPNAAVKRRL